MPRGKHVSNSEHSGCRKIHPLCCHDPANPGYFEFIPHDPANSITISRDSPPHLVDLADLELGKEYVLVISTYSDGCHKLLDVVNEVERLTIPEDSKSRATVILDQVFVVSDCRKRFPIAALTSDSDNEGKYAIEMSFTKCNNDKSRTEDKSFPPLPPSSDGNYSSSGRPRAASPSLSALAAVRGQLPPPFQPATWNNETSKL
ncbi:hypothetical protein L1887_30339 [Cichorium endivia]|nr:hypothetical protein L1887_30339 [Cichorium endivia]